MENNTNKNGGVKLWLKLLIIFALSLLLLIPQAIIQNMVDERRGTEMEANMEVCEKWGGSRTVRGPVLFIPGDSSSHNVYLLPESLDISSEVNTKTLRRGIFDFSVYESPIRLSGTFTLPKELSAEQLSHLKTGRAKLLFAINDFKGFVDYPTLTYQGERKELQAEGMNLGNDVALSCPVDVREILDGGVSSFTLGVSLKGSNSISFVPVGRTTTLHVTSDCKTPSFAGRYLPTNRHVTDSGFTADWKVLALNRDFTQVLKSRTELSNVGTMDVELKVPVEQYQKTTRTIKYAYLIILLTFAVVFLVENRRHTPIHPVQYALVGIALVLFYTLLLAFSEHIGFGLAYLVAAAMTVGLITAFIQGLLKHRNATLAVGGLLTALYVFIYVIMQLESYALLVGSIGVFVILAVAMYASQKINWK
ncbi:MAG: cell envelope integrity protein CreD [Bacteroidales bacterium]|nr:cell envelope integrity protein CreD [Bacteroidales bacterium]